MYTLQDSLEILTDYVIATEYNFIVDEMDRFSDCAAWIEYVLNDTVYGAANIVAFKDWSSGEMVRDLESLWANSRRGPSDDIMAAEYSPNNL